MGWTEIWANNSLGPVGPFLQSQFVWQMSISPPKVHKYDKAISQDSIVLNNCKSRPKTTWNFPEYIDIYKLEY